MLAAAPLIRIPPYPGARIPEFVQSAAGSTAASDKLDVDELVALVARERVGGTYWGSQPNLPGRGYVLLAVRNSADRRRLCRDLGRGRPIFAVDAKQTCDPWHLVGRADEVVTH